MYKDKSAERSNSKSEVFKNLGVSEARCENAKPAKGEGVGGKQVNTKNVYIPPKK